MTEEVTPELRLERLRRLYDVVKLHADADGKPVKLNGESRGWNMATWDCKTAACAHGSYALTPYGKEYFLMSRRGPILYKESTGSINHDAAKHFGIKVYEEHRLFGNSYPYDDPEDIPPESVLERIGELIEAYSEANDDDG